MTHDWYSDAYEACRAIADRTAIPTDTVIGIVAALSPRMRWSENLRQAELVCTTGDATHGLPDARMKARAILAGAPPLTILRGKKVRAFYRAICGDKNAVVIDTWILRSFRFHTNKPTPRQYDRLAARIRRRAKRLGVTPRELQAAIWVQIRGGAE